MTTPTIQEEVAAMERSIRAAGLTPTEFCRRANVSYTNWSRWRDGDFEPRRASWRKVQEEFAKIVNPKRERTRDAEKA